MDGITELEIELRQQWVGDPAGDLCLKMLSYMRDCPNERLSMLTYYSIGRILDKKSIDSDFLRALAILVSSKINALDEKAVFIDGEDEFIVDNDQLESIKKGRPFIHPQTGSVVEGAASRVVPFFVPSDEFLKRKSHRYG